MDHHTCVVCVGAVPCDGDAECKWCAGDRDICDSCAESRATAKERAEEAVARWGHADLRTRFAVALAANGDMARTARDACPRCGHATSLYDLADALATEDARRREADGVK